MEPETTKKTKTKATKPQHEIKKEQQAKSNEPAKDLIDLLTVLKGLSNINTLIQEGSYPYSYRDRLQAAFQNIGALYDKTLETALLHKDANKIELLREVRVRQEVANGETKKDA